MTHEARATCWHDEIAFVWQSIIEWKITQAILVNPFISMNVTGCLEKGVMNIPTSAPVDLGGTMWHPLPIEDLKPLYMGGLFVKRLQPFR